jgi:hypothetical protein
VQKAVVNLNNVDTLRIILGHPPITDALLRCFFDTRRSSRPNYNGPVRRLWLESCRISAGLQLQVEDFPYGLPLKLDFNGVESVRFRRLPLDFKLYSCDYYPRGDQEYVHHRQPHDIMFFGDFRDSASDYRPSATRPTSEWMYMMEHVLELRLEDDQRCRPLTVLLDAAQTWDDQIYRTLAITLRLPEEVVRLGRMNHEKRSRSQYRQRLKGIVPSDAISMHYNRSSSQSTGPMIRLPADETE